MKNSSKKIPISAAKEIGKKYDKDQVILVTFNKTIGDTWVTTWGKNLTDCKMAAEGGNFVKKALGWPNELTNTKPARQKRDDSKLRLEILKELSSNLSKLEKENIFGLDHYEVRDIDKVIRTMESVKVNE